MIEYIDPRAQFSYVPVERLSASELDYLRELARKARDAVCLRCAENTIDLWKAHNTLRRERPMVLAFPEGAWREILPWASMRIKNKFWRSYEWCLQRLLFRAEHIHDDHCLLPELETPLLYTVTPYAEGVETMIHSDMESGKVSLHSTAVLAEEADIRLLTPPRLIVDERRSAEVLEAVGAVLGDLLEIRQHRYLSVDTSLLRTMIELRGAETLLYDLYDRPEWVHRVLNYLQTHTLSLLDQIEQNYLTEPNTANHYVGSGGIGYTDELGTPDGQVSLNNCWGFSDAQELSHVSPAMYKEFATDYHRPLLSRFGLACYGCCESMTNKLDLVMRDISNLRRVSVSPWTDRAVAAEKLNCNYIYSWKANPALVSNGFDADLTSGDIRTTLDAAKDCVVEIILKDTHTVQQDPTRITRWVEIAKRQAECGYC